MTIILHAKIKPETSVTRRCDIVLLEFIVGEVGAARENLFVQWSRYRKEVARTYSELDDSVTNNA